MTEPERILLNKKGEVPPKTGLKILVENDTELIRKLRMISGVASVIATANGRRLTDDEWESILPYWFVESMVNKSLKEIEADENLWHFGSWIDAIQQRGWTWWSSQVEESRFIVYLETLTYPYNIDPFVYIIYSTGIKRKNIIIEELM